MTLASPGPLLPAGPAQSDWLLHFCGRPPDTNVSSSVPVEITALTPAQRLDNILWEQRLRAFPPYGADQSMVCLSESPWQYLQWLIGVRDFPPWGVFLTRQRVFDIGGAPVWYVRPDQFAGIDSAHRSWAVRLDTTPGNRSDWLHEREWRIAPTAGTDGVGLGDGSVVCILVGDPAWRPSQRFWPPDPSRLMNSETGTPAWPDDPLAVPDYREIPAVHPFWGQGRGKVAT